MSQSRELLNKVVDLINEAKLESLAQKLYLLDQVKEICLNRDTSLLPEVIPMVADFQTDFSVKARNFVVSFMREVARAHPEHADLLVPVACSLMNDDNTNIKKMAVLLANTAYRPALQRLVDDGSMESARQEWSALEALRHKVLSAITDPAGLAEIAMVAFKFAETVVLACVGGRGLGPGSSREDRSVHRDLSPAHPFLLADTLDQAGHALARQMVGWLGTGSAAGGGAGSAAARGTAWGSRFGAQHYAALINALQSLATNRAALFPDIVPGMASALESVNGGGTANANPAPGGGGKKNVNAAAAAPTAAASSGTEGGVPEGLRDAASSLRSACLRLLKVAPGPSKGVQRLAAAAALAGSDGEAKAAVDGNSALRGRIKLPSRPKERITRTPRQRARPVRILAGTADERRALADLAASACRGKVPKPPPGYKHKRTPGFPLADLELLFGHVLNAIGPDLATAKGEVTPPQHADEKASAGSKRARGSGTIEGSGKKKRRSGEQHQPVSAAVNSDGPRKISENGRSPEDGPEGEQRSGPAISASKLDPGQELEAEREKEALERATYLREAKRAFSRVLSVWEGAAVEGKRGLHQRIVARLGRVLAEAEATVMVAKRCEETPDGGESQTVVETAVDFMTEDYRRRHHAALTLLTDIYAADVAATFSDKNSGRSDVKSSSTSIAPLEGATAGEMSESIGTSIGKAPGGNEPRRGKRARGRRRGFEVYDKTLLTLLSGLSGSLESTARQKLFTQTLLECPRVPPSALEVVCGLCEAVSRPHDVQTGLVTLKDLIFHKPATRSVCVPRVLHFTHHSDNDVRTKAVRLAANLLWPDPAFQATVEAFAKQALASVRSPGLKEKMEIEGEENTSSAANAPQEQDVVDFEGDDGDEEVETSPPAPPPGMVVAGPWQAPPETETAARTRLSLYFALCVKSRQMLAGLLEAYVTAFPAAQAGLMAELPLLARAAAKGFGEPGVVGLMGDAPPGAKTLVLAMLDLLVPKDVNKPSPELVAAVRRLRQTRVAAVVEEAEISEGIAGVEYMVPVLGGLGREGVASELPALLQADDAVVRAGFRRLTHPLDKEATYTPAELLVLLNNFDHAAAGVPLKRLTSVLSLCLDNKMVYSYAVLREALSVMSQVPPAGAGEKQLPLLLMRTVMVSVTKFADLKNFVATVVLVRLVQNKVWTQPRIWDGFLRCSQMMARDSGATSFIALIQLPAARLKEALASPAMKGLKERLRRYAETLVKVDPEVKAVLGMEVASAESSSKK